MTSQDFRVRAFAAVLALAPFAPSVADACSVCYGDPNSSMVKGAAMGVWFLLAVVVAVEVGFAAFFFVYLRRRAKSYQDGSLRPSLRLVRGASR